MELIKELLVVVGRIFTIIPLLLIVTLYMGKRAIGELPVFDFLVIITLGAITGADLADPSISHIHTAVAIILIGLFQKVITNSAIKHRKFGHLITFEPTIVIQDGQLIMSNLKKIRFSIDNILQMLREKDVFNISDVQIGIIEANGNLSVLKHANKDLVTLEDMNLTKVGSSLSYPIIIDGEIYGNVLKKLDLSEDWLEQQLATLNIKTPADIFFASVNNDNELHVSLKSFMEDKQNIVPITN
ncbi:DUF421 domain-containing protein [Desulfosporosinus meridiei]|uniref:Putative membrane protein n=1 Tax=Desulfosporosinus meridiei (strain ATCC BAA-275 / DSM 13257 / KCTC 12902 / NCIMB 13706 / S10) TaxID=768704 RepID=J7IVN2_DESMD|nr:DUF421 domain-containing protein [Desulfosporosinus meridiei]AFQ42776.1 putative membrane protein [Desulfosporosinus meridiei DSM 13257]